MGVEWEKSVMEKIIYIIGGIVFFCIVTVLAVSMYGITLIFITVLLYSLLPEKIAISLGWFGKLLFVILYFIALSYASKVIGQMPGYNAEERCFNGYVCE